MSNSKTNLGVKLPAALLAAGTGAALLFGAMAGCQSTAPKDAPAPAQAVETPVAKVPDAPAPECSAKRVKPQEAVATASAYQPAQGAILRWEEGGVEPGATAAGRVVTVTAQVALLGTAGPTPLTMRVHLVQGERHVAELGAHTFLCGDGAWRCVQGVALPGNLAGGAYALSVEVSTARAKVLQVLSLGIQ